ncbi:histone-lysine N-methyltransferase SMYD3 isoform X2 [Phymastichus coffea]|uniref:histone-lysine N-methyltransferase SMYD3 isoform X2 n=1 Tax=Phymastichus coffea TaxID=108790 RepID=UPI00273AC54B|nr:histone-lysine N-methyltransferase SMYD3 isoform X2 [Phymastichus coffea]XP_058803475.1 histone-lysine N-methyltransferase SMYD3 isoform X2 [Phymastichus coffea]
MNLLPLSINIFINNGDVMQIKQGNCLASSKPFAYVLSSKHREKHCDHCFKSEKLLKCAGCHYVYYCNRVCQKDSWSIHKSECMNLKKIAPRVVPDAARLMARLIVKLQKNGEDERDYYDKYLYRKFKDLMTHYTDIKNDPKRMEHFVSICQVLQEYMCDTTLPNSAELLAIFGRICINSYNILDSDMNSIGVGIYLGPSVIDHSCKPNAIAVFDGTTILIRALEDIPILDWSQIHISYIDVLNTTETRRAELQRVYYFLCECSKCKKHDIFTTAAVCPHCSGPCDITKESCSKCTKKIDDHLKEKFKEVTDFTAQYLETMKSVAYLDISKKCLKKQINVLHSLNVQHVRTIEAAFDAAVNLTYWEDAENFGIDLLPGYIHYYGEIHPLTGLLYLMIGKIKLHLGKSKAALEMLTKAGKIINITHGEKHVLYKENLRPLICQAVAENQH